MADVVISEFLDEEAVDRLSADFDVHYDPGLVDRAGELRERLRDCRGLIVRNRTQVRASLLDAAPNLVIVGRLGVGLDNIDLDACERRGVDVQQRAGRSRSPLRNTSWAPCWSCSDERCTASPRRCAPAPGRARR